MKSLMLIVADHASVETLTGKLNILGAFSRIHAPNFPARHHAMSLVFKLGGEIGDMPNPHSLSISLTDEDGKELLNLSSPFDMPPSPPGIQPEFNAVVEFRDIVFSHPGAYSFYVRVDGNNDPIDQTTIQVTQIAQQAQE